MIKRSVKYELSAARMDQMPQDKIPEIAFIGRSNSGKSSFINILAKKKVALVSKKPGKTRLFNFFNVGQNYRLVDLPGYGFARRSKSEQNQWEQNILQYLEHRPNLIGCLFVMDIKRKIVEEDMKVLEVLNYYERPYLAILTKRDKVNQKQAYSSTKLVKEALGLDDVFVVSNQTGKGVEQAEESYFQKWVQNV